MSVAKLANQMFGRQRKSRDAARPILPFQGIHEYLSREINRAAYLSGDLRNTQESEEARQGQRSKLPTVNLQEIFGLQRITDIVQIMNPAAEYSKAYLRLERVEAIGETPDNTIVWPVSIGLSNYVRGATATKILLENMHSARLGTMIYPIPANSASRATVLFREWQTQAYQDDQGPAYQFVGYIGTENYPYREMARWFQSAMNNIQERNTYLDRRGYSGTWMATKPIERIETLTMQMTANEAVVPLGQLYAQCISTTIGAAGRTITVQPSATYVSFDDPATVFISGFRTDDPRDDALCGTINRLEGWEGQDLGGGVIQLLDYTTSMNMVPYTRIDLTTYTFFGTPVLTDTTMMFGPNNVACDLELTIRLPQSRVFSF